MAIDLQMLTDRFAIEERILMYAHLLDGKQFDRVGAEIFTEDAIIDLGGWITEGRDAIQASLGGFEDVMVGTSHNVTNIIIAIDGDTARANYRILAWHWFKQPDGDPLAQNDLLSVGGYEDQLIRLPEGWRVRRRRSFSVGTGVGIGPVNETMRELFSGLAKAKINWP